MPLHITVSNLSYTTPDGTELFAGLDFSLQPVRTGFVGRNGVGKSTLLKIITGTLSPAAGTATVSGSFGVLHQALAPKIGETIADLFGVADKIALLERASKGTATLDDLSEADWTLEERMHTVLDRFGLDCGAKTEFAHLSGGQRTRAMLAALVFAEPDFLLLDEPTNNLDTEGREAVIDLLESWRGGAVVVSHDRQLLDTMDRILELTSLGASLYGGNWTAYREQKQRELDASRHDAAVAERHIALVERKNQQRRERQERRDSGGRRLRAKGDMPKILLNAMKDNAERTAGGNANLATKETERARADAQTARDKIERLETVAIDLPSTGLPAGRRVAYADALSVGYVRPLVTGFSFTMTGPERIAVSGPNWSGKTTVLNTLAGKLPPLAGECDILVPYAFLDQQVSILDQDRSVLENFLRLNPEASENECRAALAKLKFRGDAALRVTRSLSGGQILRAGLACVLGGGTPAQLLILDEPTNHLDIESIEAVEAGLRAYDGALLVVSHDKPFLDAIGIEREIRIA